MAVLAAAALAALAGPAAAAPAAAKGPGVLHQLNAEVSAVIARVSPSVVQIHVSGYAPVEAGDAGDASLVARQHAIASGVIVDADGYVITNHHAVSGAQRIDVALPAPPAGSPPDGRRRVYPARLVGTHPESDLALLKIDARGLPALPVDGSRIVRQGELVFAIGSPQGLASTATMGVVSAVSRQAELVSPMVYIQTDAPINPGNSGGPLVNADGEVVGINTFILSGSGGSQGLGFAVPAAMVRLVYDSLRRYGHVHRIEVGASAQTITPALAAGLGLPRDWGVVVSDVVPGGPAAAGGLKEGDVLEAVDGRTVDSLAALAGALYLHAGKEPVRVAVLRGKERLALRLEGVEARHPVEQLVDLARADDHLVPRLGILAVTVDDKLRAALPPLREPRGVVVAARTAEPRGVESGLQTGDVVHAVNRGAVGSVGALRAAMDALRPGAPVVLQIERAGRLRYLAFDLE